jgi:carbonic anhydrase
MEPPGAKKTRFERLMAGARPSAPFALRVSAADCSRLRQSTFAGKRANAMRNLIQGIHQFQKEDFRELHDLFQELVHGQNPETLFITCSDSRIDPNRLTHSLPGDLFILRNAGNIVPPHGATATGEAATIEFAVTGLGVKDIIVCGHSHCGAMKALIKPEIIAEMPAMQGWLAHSEATRRIIRENYRDLNDDELLMAAIEENVLVQIEHLQTLPAVAARRARGAIHLHAWVYQFETGGVFAYDPRQQQFVPLRRLERAPTEPSEIRGQPI